MRFLAGLRLVLIAAALIGLLGGRGIVFPVAAAHAVMTMTADGGHDCCGKTSSALIDKAGLAGNCLGPGCAMVAPALLPTAPALTVSVERPATPPTAIPCLEGRALAPPLEPPRA